MFLKFKYLYLRNKTRKMPRIKCVLGHWFFHLIRHVIYKYNRDNIYRLLRGILLTWLRWWPSRINFRRIHAPTISRHVFNYVPFHRATRCLLARGLYNLLIHNYDIPGRRFVTAWPVSPFGVFSALSHRNPSHKFSAFSGRFIITAFIYPKCNLLV